MRALEQFGQLAGVKAIDATSTNSSAGFDFTHVRYTSRYLVFRCRYMIKSVGNANQTFQPVTRTELAIFNRYVKPHTKSTVLGLFTVNDSVH